MKYFTTMIKPASSLCNMRCGYCFYADVSDSREIKSYGIMKREIAEKLIDRVYEYINGPTTVNFSFQGGEPTLAGLDFFRNFIKYANKTLPKACILNFSIQTNGYLIDEDWASFLHDNNFLVGLSLDAYKEVHDFYRVDSKGEGTYKKIERASEIFDKTEVEYNILTVISRQLAKHPDSVFNSYVKKRFKHVQLILCLNPLDTEIDLKKDITPELYAAFMKRFFDLWAKAYFEGKIIHVREFENIISKILGYPGEQCGMQGYCTAQFIVESDGGVYPCDFYVLDEYKAGSIIENSVDEISRSPQIIKFLTDTEELHPLCASCKVFDLCKGGCKRNRKFYKTYGDYCPYQDFLYHSIDRFVKIAKGVRLE